MTVPTYEGIAVPPGRYAAGGAARPRYLATLGSLALVLGIATAGGLVWDAMVADETTYACPPDCGRPPNSVPVAGLPRFDAPSGAFSVSYPAPGSTYQVTTAADGVTARMTVGDRGVLRLYGEPARGRQARQVVDQLLAREFPKAEVAYELPNAMVGYQPGYGVVATFRQPGVSSRTDIRLVTVAAVKNDLALVALATGPFRRFSADFGPGPPSAANVEIAIDMGKYVESFTWNGDQPR
ncbi:MAG: hypothetical protein KIH64_013710 [Mycobacterium sp.]|nr:hypothetical protein [Mycobacterium sp.]